MLAKSKTSTPLECVIEDGMLKLYGLQKKGYFHISLFTVNGLEVLSLRSRIGTAIDISGLKDETYISIVSTEKSALYKGTFNLNARR